MSVTSYRSSVDSFWLYSLSSCAVLPFSVSRQRDGMPDGVGGDELGDGVGTRRNGLLTGTVMGGNATRGGLLRVTSSRLSMPNLLIISPTLLLAFDERISFLSFRRMAISTRITEIDNPSKTPSTITAADADGCVLLVWDGMSATIRSVTNCQLEFSHRWTEDVSITSMT